MMRRIEYNHDAFPKPTAADEANYKLDNGGLPPILAMNTGIAIGGPLNGQELSSKSETVHVPIRFGPVQGGDGFIPATYKWLDGAWSYATPGKWEIAP